MKKMFLVVIAFSAICMTGCNNSAASGDPKKVLTSFFEAMSKKDIAAARKLATADSKGTFDMMELGMKMSEGKDAGGMEKYDNSKMEIGEAKINGDQATVNVKEKSSGEAVDFVLKKESGDWKVAMDMATLMTIGMQKMKEKGMNGASIDSLRQGLDQLKNLNTDSIKEMMNKGMQTLDSLKKKMN